MFRTVLALSLFTAVAFTAMTFAATPEASAQSCWSDRTCGGKKLSAKTCASCLRGDGKSWKTAAGGCIKTCPTAKR